MNAVLYGDKTIRQSESNADSFWQSLYRMASENSDTIPELPLPDLMHLKSCSQMKTRLKQAQNTAGKRDECVIFSFPYLWALTKTNFLGLIPLFFLWYLHLPTVSSGDAQHKFCAEQLRSRDLLSPDDCWPKREVHCVHLVIGWHRNLASYRPHVYLTTWAANEAKQGYKLVPCGAIIVSNY